MVRGLGLEARGLGSGVQGSGFSIDYPNLARAAFVLLVQLPELRVQHQPAPWRPSAHYS